MAFKRGLPDRAVLKEHVEHWIKFDADRGLRYPGNITDLALAEFLPRFCESAVEHSERVSRTARSWLDSQVLNKPDPTSPWYKAA